MTNGKKRKRQRLLLRYNEIKKEKNTYETANGHGLGMLVQGEMMKSKMGKIAEALPNLISKGILLEMLAERTDEGRFDTQNIQRKRAEITNENESLKEKLMQAEKRINEIENSKIWKYSKLLRRLMDAAKKL